MTQNEADNEMIAAGTALVNALALAGAIGLGTASLLSVGEGEWRYHLIVGLGSSLLAAIAILQVIIAFRKLLLLAALRFHPMNAIQRAAFAVLGTFLVLSAAMMIAVAIFQLVEGR